MAGSMLVESTLTVNLVSNDSVGMKDNEHNCNLLKHVPTSKLPIFYLFTSTNCLIETRTVEWSNDDNMCLLTDKGAFIFTCDVTFHDSATSLYPLKHFIANPTESLSLGVHPLVKRFINNGKTDLDHMFKHTYLTDGFSDCHVGYQLASWSPRTNQHGCILALLTYDFRLTLHILRLNQWTLLVDVSLLLDRTVGSFAKNSSMGKCFELLAKLTIESMAWSDIFIDDDMQEALLLVVGTRSGHCHFFKMALNDDNPQIQLINSWQSGLGTLTYLSWYKEYLTLCPKDGQVIVLRLPGSAINPTYDDWIITPKVYPWRESDDLPVQNIFFQQQNSGTRNRTKTISIIFSKKDCLVVYSFQEILIARKTILTPYHEPLIGKTKVKTNITGLALLPQTNSYLFASPDNLLKIAAFESNGNVLETNHSINSDEVCRNLTPLGLASSPNQVLTCCAQTMTKFHDHLLLKEPTRIIIFPNLTFDSVIAKIENIVDSQSIESNQNLSDYMDFFHALRGYYMNGSSWVPPHLQNILNEKLSWRPFQCTILSLKVLRFIAVSIIYCNSSKLSEAQTVEFTSAISILEKYILQLHITKLFDQYLSKNRSQEPKELTKHQLLSLRNMSLWHKKEIDWSQFAINPEELIEKCPVCDEIVLMTDNKEACCPGNHKFGRCANSLLLCDNVTTKYEKCKLCGQHLYAVPGIWKNFWKCLFCT